MERQCSSRHVFMLANFPSSTLVAFDHGWLMRAPVLVGAGVSAPRMFWAGGVR
jgi:hypothetical protein